MRVQIIFWVIVLFTISLLSIHFRPNPPSVQENEQIWSKPTLFYGGTDTSNISRFQLEVINGTTKGVHREFSRINNQLLDFSQVYFSQRKSNKQLKFQQLSSNQYPAEQPVLLRDHSGAFHIIWAERREDPEFEEWEIPRPQATGFSTAVVYSRYNGDSFAPPVPIFEDQTSTFGIGSIGFPLRLIEDGKHRLHAVFKADSTFKTTTPDGEETEAHIPYITYLSQTKSGKWARSRFLELGSSPDIVSLSGNRLVIAWLGADPNRSGTNDVLVTVSNDNGDTWSEPELIFPSGNQAGRMLELQATSDGIIHLIWGRQTTGLPVPSEFWQSYSEDGGRSWSEPNRFFEPVQSPGTSLSFFGDFDLVADKYDRLHWAGVEARNQNGDSLSFIQYNTWNPLKKSWDQASTVDIANDPQEVDLAMDENSNELYLFWKDRFEKAIYYSTVKPGEPSPPVIAESGPLQLHPNYPNPFNPLTTIPFTLEEPGEVKITVYDITGRQVLQQELGMKSAGLHHQEINLNGMASGTYMYEVTLDGAYRQQGKMILIK